MSREQSDTRYVKACNALRENDRVLSMATRCLHRMKGDAPEAAAEEILTLLDKLAPPDYLKRYVLRVADLQTQQARFEATGQYDAQRYADVTCIARSDYNIALLLSYITTVHRWEILESLVEFSKRPLSDAEGPVLVIGSGTGYELHRIRPHLTDARIVAYDCDHEAIEFARRALELLGTRNVTLRCGELALETGVCEPDLRGTFSRVILCEVLEHLVNPLRCLQRIREYLAPGGELFVTAAVRIAQEDHVYLYENWQAAREQILAAGLSPFHEHLAPVTIMPFDETQRSAVFKRGNYVCWARSTAEVGDLR